jgi:hypothetical protein
MHYLHGEDPMYVEQPERPRKNIYESNFINFEDVDNLDELQELA